MMAMMRALLKFLVYIALLAAVVVGAAWWWAGRMAGPTIDVRQPDRFVGQSTTLEMLVEAPGGQFSRVDVQVEQSGRTFPVFSLAEPAAGTVKQDTADRLFVMRQIGKRDIPDLQPGPARIVIRAARPVLYGLRDAESEVTRDVEVRLE